MDALVCSGYLTGRYPRSRFPGKFKACMRGEQSREKSFSSRSHFPSRMEMFPAEIDFPWHLSLSLSMLSACPIVENERAFFT